MVVVIQQPNYLPFLHYIEQLARADQVILLDDVQWLRAGWQRRTRIAAGGGCPHQWLSIPLVGPRRADHIGALLVDQSKPWPLKHLRALQAAYGHRPYYESQVAPLIEPWFAELEARRRVAAPWLLKDLLRDGLQHLLAPLGFAEKIQNALWSSSIPTDGAVKTERLLRLCQSQGAEVYYAGVASTRYLDVAQFRDAGIDVHWQRFRPADYDQGRGAEQPFQGLLSAVDALANAPLAQIREWLEPNPWRPVISRRRLLQKLSQGAPRIPGPRGP